jgi:hypothetical protein
MERFDEVLDQTAVSTMQLVLGDGPAKALIHHIAVNASESDGRPFAEGLERITGGGAVIVERLIVKSLYGNLGLSPEDDQGKFSFEKSVRRARERMSSGGKGV